MGLPGRRTSLAIAFVVAILLTFVFGYRAGNHARLIRHWQNQPIRAWMSVPFIAHTHRVPATLLYSAIGAQPQAKDRRPLRRIAREQKRAVQDLITQINAVLPVPTSTPTAPSAPKAP